MLELKNIKMYGGIGALLLLVGGLIPYIGPFINIIGLIMVLVAVKSLSDLVGDEEIFKNYLYSFILTLIAMVSFIAILIIGFGAVGGFAWLTSLDTTNITDFSSFWAQFGGIIITFAIGLLIAWVFGTIGSWFLKKSYTRITRYTKVSYFETAGKLYFYGMILTIVLVGLLFLIIAKILEILAFFSLPDMLPSTTPDPQQNIRRCVNCGRVIPVDAHVCPYCAKIFEEDNL